MKIHTDEDKKVLSVCDTELIGKTFEEGDNILNLAESFFNGSKASIESIIAETKSCNSAHLVGNNLVAGLLENKIIEEHHVKEISGNSHVMIFRI